MKYMHLIWAALMRSKIRTALTMLSVIAAFLLFGMLDSVRVAFNSSANVSGYGRMIVASRLSITQTLPLRIFDEIGSVPGVKAVSYGSWFGGVYRDPSNRFPSFAVSPGYMAMYPEYVLTPEQIAAFEGERTAAVVGKSLALRHGWKVGDIVPLQSAALTNGGSNDWSFRISAIFEVAEASRKRAENVLMFNWQYFDEANDIMKNRVGWYIVELHDPSQATQVANAIDALFENSSHEARTQTEQAFNQAFVKQFADIGLIVTSIMGAVFFTLLLVTGNAMAQAVRERVPELATLKTLGFSDTAVLLLVLCESLLLIGMGGGIGLGLAALLMPGLSEASGGLVQLPGVPAQTLAIGTALIAGIGLVVGVLPALRAMRLNIVDAFADR